MRNAYLAGAMAAIPFGLIGTFIVVRRIGYLAGGIAHCAFGGIGVGLYLQSILGATLIGTLCDPANVSIFVAILSALFIGWIRIHAKEREDTLIGIVWAVGMALGLLLIELTPGSTNISNFLLSNILAVTQRDLFYFAILSSFVVGVVLLFFKRFEAICFDEEFATLRGLPTTFYFQLLLVLTAMTVVLLLQVVGIILVIALLTLPAATAAKWTGRLFPMAILAILLAWSAIWFGLILCAGMNTTAGPTIVLVAAAEYLLSLMLRRNSGNLKTL